MSDDTPPEARSVIATLVTFRGRTVALSCELDGNPAPKGRAYVTIEVDLHDARLIPMSSIVNLTAPTAAEHIRCAVDLAALGVQDGCGEPTAPTGAPSEPTYSDGHGLSPDDLVEHGYVSLVARLEADNAKLDSAPGCPHGRRAGIYCGACDDDFASAADIRKQAAFVALGALTGPERVEVLRHYGGSAKKAIAANQPREPIDVRTCGHCNGSGWDDPDDFGGAACHRCQGVMS